ncbi:hypothetical protein [Kamptonema formosum]|uniref:hypothetical protein n=1 Tax=Kamptonema formosum TaxID=331992 RepID=UPI0012DDEE31|nr:hypothetical protein [Oscillatoria sp. PCC 10802]
MFRGFITLRERVKAEKIPFIKLNILNLLSLKGKLDVISFLSEIEVYLLGKACGLSGCRFGNHTEITRRNAGIPRSGRIEFAPPWANTRSALRGREQGSTVCGLACLDIYIPALPVFKKQYEPDGKDGKYLKSIKGWYKKEKVRLHSVLEKQKLCLLSWRKLLGYNLDIYCSLIWRKCAFSTWKNSNYAVGIREFINPKSRLIINSHTFKQISEIRVVCYWEQKQKIREETQQSEARTNPDSLPPREGKGFRRKRCGSSSARASVRVL